MNKFSMNPIFSSLLVLLQVLIGEASMCQTPFCADRQEFRQFTKQNIKTEILRKLGLDAAPNVTLSQVPGNHHIRNLIRKMETESEAGMLADEGGSYDDDHFQAKEITILPSRPSSPLILEHKHWNTLYFGFNHRVYEDQGSLQQSNLLLHLPAAPGPAHTQARVRVYYIGVDKYSGKPTQFKAKDGTWELKQNRGGFVKVDLTNLVRKWLKNPSENLGIVIRAQTNLDMELSVPTMDSHMAPYLQLLFGLSSHQLRSKRSTNQQCREEYDSDVTQCCLWPLTIDFTEFGWEWVLFPKTYDANFCSGDCALGEVPESPHTHLLQMNLHSAAGPCCSARKMSQISMLYLDQDNNVVMGTLPRMKVEKCGCS